jgi:hypothetical protein
MYRTIIAGWHAGERGRGAVSLAHVISVAPGARHRRRLRRIVESVRRCTGHPARSLPTVTRRVRCSTCRAAPTPSTRMRCSPGWW